MVCASKKLVFTRLLWLERKNTDLMFQPIDTVEYMGIRPSDVTVME